LIQLAKLVAPEQKSVRAKLVRNVLFSWLRGLVLWPVPFLLIPFVIGKIGTHGYGTWAVFLTVINLTALADLGLGGTLTKQVAERYARNDIHALSRLLNTALVLYIAVSLIVVAVLRVGSGHLLSWMFRGSASSPSELFRLWRYLLGIVSLNILTMLFHSVVTGLQRIDLSAVCGVFYTLGGAALTLIFLVFGWGLPGLLLANLLATLLTVILLAWMAHRLLPGVVLNPREFRWSEVDDIFRFSVQLYTIQMATTIQHQVEKLYLAWFVGVVPVGWYTIASDASARIRRIPELLLAPVMAAASELDARGDDRRVEELYFRLHKYLAFIGVPLVFYVVAMSNRFVALWLGPQFEGVAFALTGLIWVNFLNLLTAPGVLILTGKGQLRPAVNSALVAFSLVITLSFVLIYKLGFSGAVGGVVVADIVAASLFLYWFHSLTAYPFRRIVREAYLKPTVCSLVLVGSLLLSELPNRSGWVWFSINTSIFVLFYLAGLVVTRFFDLVDLAQVESFLPLARVARRVLRTA
jgi:O-antigen/teichoic acid export membrane protein